MSLDYIKIDTWTGSRKEFLKLINEHEKIDPTILLIKNITKEPIPANIRRLNSFSAAGIFPKEIEDRYSMDRLGWELKFSSDHYYRYSLTMKLRKEGYKLENIVKMISGLSKEEIRDKVINWNKAQFENYILDDKTNKNISISEKLKKLGRVDGRVLESQQLRFAVTPWFHTYITKKELEKISNSDIDILAEALSKKLKEYNKKNKI